MFIIILARRTGIVDVPNAVATLAVPLRIFSVDVRPKKLLPGVSVKVRVSSECIAAPLHACVHMLIGTFRGPQTRVPSIKALEA